MLNVAIYVLIYWFSNQVVNDVSKYVDSGSQSPLQPSMVNKVEEKEKAKKK